MPRHFLRDDDLTPAEQAEVLRLADEATAFLGSVYTQIVVFSVVILALALMPNGLFGRAAINKV